LPIISWKPLYPFMEKSFEERVKDIDETCRIDADTDGGARFFLDPCPVGGDVAF